jgi:hypothetical protein
LFTCWTVLTIFRRCRTLLLVVTPHKAVIPHKVAILLKAVIPLKVAILPVPILPNKVVILPPVVTPLNTVATPPLVRILLNPDTVVK